MQYASELLPRISMDDTNVHASVISGKVRISSFTYTATAADTQVTIAYLPAGRGRALPTMTTYMTTGVTGTVKIGLGSYTDAVPGVGTVPAVADNISSNSAGDGTTKIGSGAPVGIPYHSVEDVPVIMSATTIPVGATIAGVIVYNVT